MADSDLISQQEARDAVDAAHRAFGTLAAFDQARVDAICEAMANAALADAARLGQLAHEETGFGKAEDKREKNRFAAEDVWNYFKGLKTVGVVADNGSVVEIASPRGVVAAIIPSTNPTSTAIFKIIIAIKSRNPIVLSPHPSAAKCIAETTRVMKEAGVKAGLPDGAVQCLTDCRGWHEGVLTGAPAAGTCAVCGEPYVAGEMVAKMPLPAWGRPYAHAQC
jgi:acyl-CoA reductase-like NAD-dependent aldehyde dehydrogenase